MDMGERIALLRKQAGWSQEQLGDKLGVSRQAVSKWESGQVNPDLQYIMALCRLFEVTSDYILFGEDAPGREAPARCPGCGGIVTAMDEFCPKCGLALRRTSEERYALVVTKMPFSSDRASTLYWIATQDGVERLFPVEDKMTYARAETLVRGDTDVLCRMDRMAAVAALRRIHEYEAFGFYVYRWKEGRTAQEYLASGSSIHRKDFPESGRKEPMSFWTTVGAVAVGVVLAMFLLSLL